MAHKVSDACVGCGACEGACPVGAVTVENGVAVVNADACIDCGACEGAIRKNASKAADLFKAGLLLFVCGRFSALHNFSGDSGPIFW